MLIPTPDVQRLLWIPGVGRVVAFTIWLEAAGIGRPQAALPERPRLRQLLPPGARRRQLGWEDPARSA